MKKQFLFIFLAGLFILSLSSIKVAQAQETAPPISAPPITDTSEIKAQDLGIIEPTILPTSRFYFVKNLWRGISLLITRDPVKKAELRLKYANEKLLEVRNLTKKAEVKTEVIEKQLENFQKDLEKIKEQIEKIETKKTAVAENLREKYLEQSLKQQLILQKLATQVPVEVYSKIEENRQEHLQKLGEVVEKVAEKQDITEKVRETVQSIAKVQPMVHTQTVEIFKNLEEKVPENLKPKITEVKIEAIKNAAQAIRAIPVEKREELKEIVKKQLEGIANPITAVEIADEVAETEPTLKPVIEEIKTKPVENLIETRLKNLPPERLEPILNDMLIPPRPTSLEPTAPQVKPIEPIQVKRIEILKTVQQKLSEQLPEQSKAPEVLERVINRSAKELGSKVCELSRCDCKCYPKGRTPEKLENKVCQNECPGVNCFSEDGVTCFGSTAVNKQEDLGKPITEEELKTEGYVYINHEYGFKLVLKPANFWKDYKVEKRGQGVGNYATERFDFLIPTETQNWPSYPLASIFMLEIFTPQQWENVFPKPEYLNKNEKYVYAYTPAQDLPKDIIKKGGAELGKIIKAVMKTFELIGPGTIITPISPDGIIQPVRDFCGKSSFGSCQTDADCITSGCSGQICQARNDEPIATTCEWRDCYDAKRFGLRCGCFEEKCQWSK